MYADSSRVEYQGVSWILQGRRVVLWALGEHAQQAALVQEALQPVTAGVTGCTAASHSCIHNVTLSKPELWQFVRQDTNGFWSHKPGEEPSTNL